VAEHKDIVVIAWDGVSGPFKHIKFDAELGFRLFAFNYSGNGASVSTLPVEKTISIKTEFKGQLISELCAQVKNESYRYIGILDDDQEISVSGINKLIQIAEQQNADTFQPSVSPDSYYSHKIFLHREGVEFEKVYWVEIMAPFIRKEIFESGEKFYQLSISSYGIDQYVLPYLQYKLTLTNSLLIHAVIIKHLKPVTDGSKVFSNGLDARQEGDFLKNLVKKNIYTEKIPMDTKTLKAIFGHQVLPLQKWKYDIKRFLKLK
jgi:hypothetical protein